MVGQRVRMMMRMIVAAMLLIVSGAVFAATPSDCPAPDPGLVQRITANANHVGEGETAHSMSIAAQAYDDVADAMDAWAHAPSGCPGTPTAGGKPITAAGFVELRNEYRQLAASFRSTVADAAKYDASMPGSTARMECSRPRNMRDAHSVIAQALGIPASNFDIAVEDSPAMIKTGFLQCGFVASTGLQRMVFRVTFTPTEVFANEAN